MKVVLPEITCKSTCQRSTRKEHRGYEVASESFRTESITKKQQQQTLVEKQHKGLRWQKSLDWLRK